MAICHFSASTELVIVAVNKTSCSNRSRTLMLPLGLLYLGRAENKLESLRKKLKQVFTEAYLKQGYGWGVIFFILTDSSFHA